jgi:hypothetical protein
VSEPKPKPFEISKWAVCEAYRSVKANKGAAGVDEQSIAQFEGDLKRISARPLVAGRGWGPVRSAAGERTWVVDLDLKSFFDSVPHDLVLRAVARHTDRRWVILYVERWRKGRLEHEDGSLVERDRGTPQGSAISPLLANVFLHYAFDRWMAREFPVVRFERYCDDVIVHARSEQRARDLPGAIASRLAACGLELNERKTRIVYCKDANRRGSYEHESFDFLGYTFRRRLSKSRHGKHFVNFSPAVSGEAGKRIGREIRRWRLHRWPDKILTDLAVDRSDPSEGGSTATGASTAPSWSGFSTDRRIPHSLGHAEIQAAAPPPRPSAPVPGRRPKTQAGPVRSLAVRRAPRRLGDGSRMTGDCHVRFCERPGVRVPPAAHPPASLLDRFEGRVSKTAIAPITRGASVPTSSHPPALAAVSATEQQHFGVAGPLYATYGCPDQTARRTARSPTTRGSEAEQPVTQRNLRL